MVVFPLPGQQQLCRFHFCLILVYTVDLKHIASSSSVCFTLLCGRQVKDIRTAFQGSQRTFSLLVFWNNLLPTSETLGLSFFFSNFSGKSIFLHSVFSHVVKDNAFMTLKQ